MSTSVDVIGDGCFRQGGTGNRRSLENRRRNRNDARRCRLKGLEVINIIGDHMTGGFVVVQKQQKQANT